MIGYGIIFLARGLSSPRFLNHSQNMRLDASTFFQHMFTQHKHTPNALTKWLYNSQCHHISPYPKHSYKICPTTWVHWWGAGSMWPTNQSNASCIYLIRVFLQICNTIFLKKATFVEFFLL
jgi:hypothetical protein